MVKGLVVFALYRIVLPIILLTAVASRFNFFSFVYLLLMLVNPLLPGISLTKESGHARRYQQAVLSISIIFCLLQVVFQIVMLSIGEYGAYFDYSTWEGRLYALIGFHRLDKIDALDAICLVGLDFLVLFTSLGVFLTCEKLQETSEPVLANQEQLENSDVQKQPVRRRKKQKSELLYWTGEVLVLVFLAGAGILHPSLTSAVYFLTFLAVCTWISCNQKIGKKYLYTKIPLLVFCALHFILLYLYQLDYAQEILSAKSLMARLLGLTDLVDHSKPKTLIFRKFAWPVYVSPFVILSLYWLLAVIIRINLYSSAKEEVSKDEPAISRVDSKQSSQHSSGSVRRRRQSRRIVSRGLLDEDHMNRSYRAIESSDGAKDTLAVDPNGSIIWTSESDMPDGVVEDAGTVTSGGLVCKLRRAASPLISALRLIAKGSYVATLIIMMTWSITYHSWLTFVLLLWSCILWMCPNSRQACLRSSPALVIYAEALLLLQYILGLQLNNDELPPFDKNVVQIGLTRYGDLTYQPLAIKILYTVMFWFTLHQFLEERQQSRARDIAEGVMMEPFNISYGTAQPGFPRPSLRRHFSIAPSATSPNPYIRIIAEQVYDFLVKYWIWVVAIMLMVISLSGERVVIYRIVYMFLFLFFILMFQFSYQIWRKIMYGFWLTVIVFSMLVLILIYTYQFKDFDKYWAEYLKINLSVQRDLGLEVYDSDTGTLFLRLLTPTFFLIITIIQLHYFHREFLLISDIKYRSDERLADETQLTAATAIANDESNQTQITIEPETKILDEKGDEKQASSPCTEVACNIPVSPVTSHATPKKDGDSRTEREFQAVKDCMEGVCKKLAEVFLSITELLWRLLELHIVKIVMFSMFCLAAYDVCAIHVIFVVFVIIALPVKSLQSFFSHCGSVWAAVLLLSKMIYQLNIVDYLKWGVNCTDVLGPNVSLPFNETIDNREWIGYKRTDNLADYCKGYIGLILVLTIQAVVKIRQKGNRTQLNEPEPNPGTLFPDSTRATADSSLLECLKYLVNYFFYKFGLEFCFVTIVACIGVRLDVFALLSAVWLLCIFLLRRKTLAKIWPVYIAYQCIVLPIQYIMCVGLPPGMCLEYPHFNLHGLREWLFFPDYQDPPEAHKIIADFFQLLFASCQLFVFQIETGPFAEMYEGGSNKEINFEDGDASANPNPIPDFVTYTKSGLDMLKVFIFFSFYWGTLAVVFIAGTTRVNIFAMGYVVGCFFFLWNGNEFYLKSRKAVLELWNVLLIYNVTVIVLQPVLQLVGCIYIDALQQKKYCWLVQLLGITCLHKGHNQYDENLCRSDGDAGVMLDGICFGFLLLQKRLFSSYYFQHLVNEIKAQQVLSSRGAELIHEIQMKEVQEQQALEREIMEKIKKKMDRIRAYQQKIRGGENMEPETHFQAIRSGDYYMFEEYSDDEIDLELSARHKRGDDDDEDSAEVKERGLNALLSKTIKSNLKVVDEPRKGSGEVDDIGDSSQQSAIVSADRFPLTSGTSEKTSFKSPDPLTITSSGPTMSLSMPSSASTSTVTSPKDEDTVAPASPQDVKLEEEPPKEETFVEKVKRSFAFLIEFISSVLISTTAKLNAVSKDYRFVARQLSKEKKLLKEKYIRGGSFDMEEAEGEMKSRDADTLPSSSKDSKQFSVVMKKTSLDFLDSADLMDTPDALDAEFQKNQPILVRFFVACYYAAISRSELLCYMIIIVNQMKSASILSLPLPLFVFLWGTLSVPRPTKAFWITIITYTEAIVVVKYLFQFYFFSWNESPPPPNNPFYPPVILGIKKDDNYAVYDLIVLLVVFFHRFMLKSLGLWKDTERSFLIPVSDINAIEKPPLDEKEDSTKKLPQIPEIAKPPLESDDQHLYDDECYESDGSETLSEEEKVKVDVFGSLKKFIEPVKMFFYHLLYPEYRVTVDVYAFMFFCDFINFFIVVFGYGAFGTGGSEAVTKYFEENKVPIPFLIMLIAQFALIVTDRALYLRKYILGKLIFQIILIFVVHMWMFFILPAITLRDFTDSLNLYPKMWYFIKCVYLLLSAHQIRSGYPTRILGNFFCKKYNYANLFLFKGYMVIPFLYELRSLMDWIWTDTSMNISNWLKMEDIYANIFVLKCQRRAEAYYPTPRGAKRTALIKYGVGGFLLFIIILVIWFPLLLFALGNTVGKINRPISCTVELAISGYEPIFRMSVQQSQILTIGESAWKSLEKEVMKLADPSATNFLANYDQGDTVIVQLNSSSTSIWTISPPSQIALKETLREDNSDLKMTLSWSFLRDKASIAATPEVRGKQELNLMDKRHLRESLADMLEFNASTYKGTVLNDIFPNYVKVPPKGVVEVVKEFYIEGKKSSFGNSAFRSLNISMSNGSQLNVSDSIEWWEVQDDQQECGNHPPYGNLGIRDCNFLRLIAFSEKVFPSELQVISGYGIVGLYTTFVLVVSRVVRGFVAGSSFTIMFDDMPYVDRVLQLCLDIYLVRESNEFTLEEDLFAKLIFLYRSPETLIKWTRPPDNETTDDEPERLQLQR